MKTMYFSFTNPADLYSMFKLLQSCGCHGKTPSFEAAFMSVCGVTYRINTSKHPHIVLENHANFFKIG